MLSLARYMASPLSLLLLGLVLIHSALASEAEVIRLNLDKREISVWHWQQTEQPKGVIIFSHGAASAPWKYDPLISPWVEQGYAVYAPLHVDSTDHPQHDQYQGLASWLTRLQDMQLLADSYGKQGYIAAGHSYGGLTALVKGGAKAMVPQGLNAATADPRVSLVLAFSPPAAIPGFIEKAGYSELAVPALIQTGTQDIPIGGATDWRGHLDAYEMAPASGDHYALVLDGVDHYFGGAICRPELPGPKQLQQLQQASDISLLLLEAYVQKQQAALQQLDQRATENSAELSRK